MKDKRLKYLFIIFVICLIIFAIYIIRKQPVNKNNPVENQPIEEKIVSDLRLGISEYDTIDPIISKNRNAQNIATLIYEPLITITRDYKLKGELATEWAKTAENSYIIKLKEGVKWHNGEDFTAEDVVYSINKIKQAEVSIYKDNVANIQLATVVDLHTVKLELINANEPFFEYNLIFPIQTAKGAQTSILAGTGMFKIDLEDEKKIVLKRNQYKENIENVKIKTIIVNKYLSMGEMYNDFKIGNVDLIQTNNINYSEHIGTLGYNVKEVCGREYDFLAINTRNNALYNVEVRKAISFAIDKGNIVSEVYNNKYFVADFPLGYGSWLFNKESTSSGYNPEQSKQILSENGWKYENNLWKKTIDNKVVSLQFNLVVNSDNENRYKVAQIIKNQLEAVGIKVNIIKTTTVNQEQYIRNKNYDLILLGINVGVSPDLSLFIGENNPANYENEEVYNILTELPNITDENIIKEKYKRIIEIYKNDIPYISLYFNSNITLYSEKVAGDIDPNWYNLFYNISGWYVRE